MMIEKACVIGAGVMGASIAAHIANAGVPVVLLDVLPTGAKDAVAKLAKMEPAPLMSPRAAKLIDTGTMDDLKKLADCDWIIEAVAERLEIKQQVYAQIDQHRKPGSIVSSNTSTLPLKMLMSGVFGSLTKDFCITHFFNPPRYMRLLEIISGDGTRPEVVETLTQFCDEKLGKSVVRAKDTPGFIANRIGIFWIQCAVNAARDLGLTVEEADAVMGKPIGAPKSGIFDLLDIVGLDLQPMIDKSLRYALPKADAYQALSSDFPLLKKMISEGLTGRKGKGGFYRLNAAGGKKVKEAINLNTGDYAPAAKPRLDSVEAAKGGLKALITHKDKGGQYAWAVMSQLLPYVASLVPEISDSIADVDLAMRTGFNWKRGPFEMMDQLGAAWFADRLKAEGKPVPPLLAEAAKQGGFYRASGEGVQQLSPAGYRAIARPSDVIRLADIKLKSKPLAKNASASVWDVGDGVACLEFHSKMNAIDPDTLAMAGQAVGIASRGMKALVLYNEGENFSVGANIGLALFAANVAAWPVLEELIAQGQQVMKALKFAPVPVIAAPHGMVLGGGCEFVLHCSGVQAHAELYMGLVEVGVGIVPGWGGCKEMLLRHQPGARDPHGPMPAIMAAFEQISMAKVSRSAADAQDMKLLRRTDGITMNRDRLLHDAKARALKMAADGYKPPEPQTLNLPGPTARAALKLAVDGYALQGLALPHDVTVTGHLAKILSGGNTDVTQPVSEDQVMALEKQAFMALVRTDPTLARIDHMLTTGKPLRN
jgi:3-hydroxyacyl-CoA dehydrogenase